jgi:copper(I)-binding protein
MTRLLRRILTMTLAVVAAHQILGSETARAEADLRLIDPWVRDLRPGTTVTGGFMILQNDGTTDDVLLSVESPSAKTVEIHETVEKDGMMKMQKLNDLKIPAGKRVVLSHGGYHLMFLDVQKTDEVEKDWITVKLTFKESGVMEFKAPLRGQVSNTAKKDQ